MGRTEVAPRLTRTPATRRAPGAAGASRWLTIAPAVALIAMFTLFPLVYAAYTSVHGVLLTRPGSVPFVGLGNYADVLGGAEFATAARNTLLFTAVTVPVVTVFGLAVALLLNQRMRGIGWLRVLVLLPWSIPLVSAGIIWRLLLHGDFGAANGALLQLGLTDHYVAWLSSPDLAMGAVILAHLWREFPLPAVLFLAGLQTIPAEALDAARVDGAGPWQRFRYVTLPLLRGPLLIVLVYETTIAIAVFDLVYVLTGGGPGTATTLISWLAYVVTFRFLNLGQGAALSFLISLAILLLVVAYMRVVRVREEPV